MSRDELRPMRQAAARAESIVIPDKVVHCLAADLDQLATELREMLVELAALKLGLAGEELEGEALHEAQSAVGAVEDRARRMLQRLTF